MNVSYTGPVISQKIAQWMLNETMSGNYIPVSIFIGAIVVLIGIIITLIILDKKKKI